MLLWNKLFKLLHLDILRWYFWGLYIAIEKTYKNITTAYVLGLNDLSEIDCEEIICLFIAILKYNDTLPKKKKKKDP